MANIVECPICDTKYDITSLKNGMKLKCTRCHKVVGTISGGALLPILETIKAPIMPKKAPVKVVAEDEEGEYEEVIVRKRIHKGGEPETPKAPREIPPAMLVLAGVTGLAAIVTVVYITFMLYQPENIFRAPSRHTAKTAATDTNPEK
ncbi:MAG: hypothetical protein HZA49_03955 [Planctomycetes bacterium]|nr:hypothetical protein [Planctomycetota bacterium]